MKTSFVIISLVICATILSFFIGSFYAYYYPMKYKEQIVEYSKSYEVDGALIASVANVESNFRENAISKKGAVGIMQILPSTAEWIAGQMGEEYNKDKLEEGEYNLKLGSFYLSYLIEYFGEIKLAVCAYNAGQGNVKNWLKDDRYSSDGIKLNKIPFKETENYLNKVLKNYKYYKNRYK